MRNDRVKGQSHGFARAFRMVGNRHGAALAIVAISLVVILGMGALAVDMGMLIKQRDDAQRAADAAALAGASAFQEGDPLDVLDIARDRAFSYLAQNYVGHDYVDTTGQSTSAFGSVRVTTSAEGTVVVLPDSEKVRVIVRRPAVGTLFARVLGFFNVSIAAKAAAVAASAGGAGCLMPFAIPDAWDERSPSHTVKLRGKDYPAYDKNNNRVEDGTDTDTEHWTFDAGVDRYSPFDPTASDPTQTGLGSAWRDGTGTTADFGRQVLLKPQSPQDGAGGPSNFYLWGFDGDDAGRGDEGGVFDRILHCDPRTVHLDTPGTEIIDTNLVIPGNSVSIADPVQELIDRDPDAYWDESTHSIQGSNAADWRNSGRVVKIAVFNPAQLASLGNRQPIVFNNIALFFLETAPGTGPHDNVMGRFLYYASGGPTSGPATGSLVKTLRLVE